MKKIINIYPFSFGILSETGTEEVFLRGYVYRSFGKGGFWVVDGIKKITKRNVLIV